MVHTVADRSMFFFRHPESNISSAIRQVNFSTKRGKKLLGKAGAKRQKLASASRRASSCAYLFAATDCSDEKHINTRDLLKVVST